MSLIGQGATGAVYQLNAFIAVKRARTGEDEQADHANEQRMFHFLENCSSIPYMIRCYYRRPQDTFLEFAPNETVAMLLNQYQERDSYGTRVLRVSQSLESQDIHRWMRQLCFAAAGLERIGLVHGDISPGNMLLDADWNLKLGDLDRGMEIGEDIEVLTEPFGRLLGEGDGEHLGLTAEQVLGQKPLLSAPSITYSYVVTSLTRPNLGAEITLSFSARSFKTESSHRLLIPLGMLSYVSAGAGITNGSMIFWRNSLVMLGKMNLPV